MKYTHIVWDFNGTILDDVGIDIKCVNALLSRRSLPTIDSEEQYRQVFRFPVIEYYRDLGFDLDGEGYDKIAHEWVREYRAIEHTAPVRAGAVDIIDYFRNRGVTQIILSASEQNMLNSQLCDLGIYEKFDEVLGTGDIYAGGKSHIAVEWAKGKDISALMIGDSTHDFDTARAAGFDCALVCGGHESKERLKSTGCPVFDDFSALFEALKMAEVTENGI